MIKRKLMVAGCIVTLLYANAFTAMAEEAKADTDAQILQEIEDGRKTMIATLVMAEAGNQDLTGKRLVVDVVLNRVDDPRFPNTIEGVIYEEGQFEPMTNGAFEEAMWTITPDCFKAVEMEWNQRLNYDYLWFYGDGVRNHFY